MTDDRLIGGRLNDGRTSAVHEVALLLDIEGRLLRLVAGGDAPIPHEPWPLDEIRLIDHHRGRARFCLMGREGARLTTDDRGFQLLRAHCPNLKRRQAGLWSGRQVALWSGVAVVGLAATLFLILPRFAHEAALLMPRSVDARMGEATEQAIGRILGHGGQAQICVAPAGRAALDKLMARLAAADGLSEPPKVTVLRTDVMNAFAVPGNRIILLSGLLDRAESASSLAGVMGHEMGHIHYHHPTESVVRNSGLSLLIGLATGDIFGLSTVSVGTLALTQSAYSRQAEQQADRYALQVLAKAGIEAAPLGRFYRRVAREQEKAGVMPTLLSSHPDPGDRQALVEREGRPGGPALSDEEWKALLSICDQEAAAAD